MFQILPVFGAKIQIFSIPRNWIFMFWSFSSTLSTILIPNSWFYSVYSCNPTFDPDPVYSRIAQPLTNGVAVKKSSIETSLTVRTYVRLTFVVRGPRQTCIWTSQKRHIPHIRTTTPNSHHTIGAWQQQTLHVHYQGGNIISLRRTLPSMLCTCLTSMLSYAFFLDIFHP